MAQARRKSQVSRAPKKRPVATARRKPARERVRQPGLSREARACRAKFLHYFPQGFYDPTYLDWERGYKWAAHLRWEAELGREKFGAMLAAGNHAAIAANAVAIESRTNLLFSFEKMALRDAVKTPAGARAFAQGLFDFLHGSGDLEGRFETWCEVVESLPRRQTRVLTWPLVTVFGFTAQPATHFFLKPTVTRLAAERYGAPFDYRSRPNWDTYRSVLALARTVRRDLASLRPRDMIDIQSFLWVQGSDEYPD
jgi:hypothetical protein